MAPPEGMVIGIHGDWGSGKSTVMEFIVHYLSTNGPSPVIIRFNPWWFSSGESLITHFFSQVSATLGNRFQLAVAGLVDNIKKLSAVVSEVPLPIPGLGLPKVIAGVIPDIGNRDIFQLKNDIAKRFTELGSRIIVFIDDIDRLSADQMRQLFTVIKAIADFPNVLYVIAFDKKVVSQALGEFGLVYLEKIVQVSFELPLPTEDDLRSLLGENINQIVDGRYTTLQTDPFWKTPSNLAILLPKIVNTPRKIAKLTNALSVTFPAVQDEVFVDDFILIETTRLFYPALYDLIRRNKSQFAGSGITDITTALYSQALTIETEDATIFKQIIASLFPKFARPFATYQAFERQWRDERRIASTEVFDTYFRLAIPDNEISEVEFQTLLSTFDTTSHGEQTLVQFAYEDPKRLRSLVNKFEQYSEHRVDEAHARVLISAILNIGDQLILDDKPNPWTLDYGIRPVLIVIVKNCVKRFPCEIQFSELQGAFTNGRADDVALLFFLRVEHVHNRLGYDHYVYDEDKILREEDMQEFEYIMLARMARMIHQPNFLNKPEAINALRVGLELDQAFYKQWIAEQLKEPEVALLFVRRFITTSVSGLGKMALDNTIGSLTDLKALRVQIQDMQRRNVFPPTAEQYLTVFLEATNHLDAEPES